MKNDMFKSATGGNCWVGPDAEYLGPAPCDLYEKQEPKNTIPMYMTGYGFDKMIVKVMVEKFNENHVWIYSALTNESHKSDRRGFYSYWPTYNDAANFLWNNYKQHTREVEERIEKLFSELREIREKESDILRWLKNHNETNLPQ